MKNKKAIIAAAIIAVVAIVAVLVHRIAFAKDVETYRFATVSRGDLRSTVSATGTLGAVKTVSVGTQVSGRIDALLVDFNDEVRKGQLLARVDPTLAQQTVTDAQANVERAQAQLLQAQREYTRNRQLGSSGLIAKSEIESTQSSQAVAQAAVKSARIALQRARQNLSYTNIYSPIDGVIVERNVDEGQTVAASLSAPQLFLIANDLSRMQILAQVGESDIASIKEGQPAEFTVQALQGQTFKGTVEQVRLQSKTQENVVNYTVVVSVENPDGKLLPGMTARVEFLTRSATDVFTVANSALRFKPTEEQVAKLQAARRRPTTSRADSDFPGGAPTSTTGGAGRRTRGQGAGGGRGGSSMGTLYYLDEKGELQAMRVRTGINDGSNTEILGRNLKEGMKVISGLASSQQTAQTSTAASPFGGGNNSQQQRRGPGGF